MIVFLLMPNLTQDAASAVVSTPLSMYASVGAAGLKFETSCGMQALPRISRIDVSPPQVHNILSTFVDILRPLRRTALLLHDRMVVQDALPMQTVQGTVPIILSFRLSCPSFTARLAITCTRVAL